MIEHTFETVMQAAELLKEAVAELHPGGVDVARAGGPGRQGGRDDAGVPDH
jgi:hypothetical protein